jgi:hypothetical protein
MGSFFESFLNTSISVSYWKYELNYFLMNHSEPKLIIHLWCVSVASLHIFFPNKEQQIIRINCRFLSGLKQKMPYENFRPLSISLQHNESRLCNECEKKEKSVRRGGKNRYLGESENLRLRECNSMKLTIFHQIPKLFCSLKVYVLQQLLKRGDSR